MIGLYFAHRGDEVRLDRSGSAEYSRGIRKRTDRHKWHASQRSFLDSEFQGSLRRM
jgi:hypothetical protein